MLFIIFHAINALVMSDYYGIPLYIREHEELLETYYGLFLCCLCHISLYLCCNPVAKLIWITLIITHKRLNNENGMVQIPVKFISWMSYYVLQRTEWVDSGVMDISHIPHF